MAVAPVVVLSVVVVTAGVAGDVVVVVVLVVLLPAGVAAVGSVFWHALSRAVDRRSIISRVDAVVVFFMVILPG